MKRLDVMYETSSSTQSGAQGQEQQDPGIHAMKRNGFDGCTAHRSMCSTTDSTHLHMQVLRQRWIPAFSCTNTVVMHVYPFWLPLCVFPNCRFFCTQPGVYFLKPSAEFPESCAYFGAAERLYACKYFMLSKASKLSF